MRPVQETAAGARLLFVPLFIPGGPVASGGDESRLDDTLFRRRQIYLTRRRIVLSLYEEPNLSPIKLTDETTTFAFHRRMHAFRGMRELPRRPFDGHYPRSAAGGVGRRRLPDALDAALCDQPRRRGQGRPRGVDAALRRRLFPVSFAEAAGDDIPVLELLLAEGGAPESYRLDVARGKSPSRRPMPPDSSTDFSRWASWPNTAAAGFRPL